MVSETHDKDKRRSPLRKRPRLGRMFRNAKSGAKLALQHRKDIENGDFSPFIPALVMAISKDALFDMIPVIGGIGGFFISVYLFVFLFGKGKWKVRIVLFFLSLFDFIPAVNLLPFSTICVLYTFYEAKKRASEAEEKLKLLKENENEV